MILVVGGMAQGKRRFAEETVLRGMFGGENAAAGREAACGPVRWADGERASFAEFAAAPFGCHFHSLIRRLLAGDSSLMAEEKWLRMADRLELAGELTDFLFEQCRDRVLVTEEIGCGIIPLDPAERLYREQAGRVCCRLAEKSEQVWRVVCGSGGRIK